MTGELKPVRCGCGGEAHYEAYENYNFGSYIAHIMICDKCGMRTAEWPSEAEAIEAWNRAMSGNSKMKTDIYFRVGKRSGKTLESAVDYLRSVGWLQEHDRIMTESAEPERTAKVQKINGGVKTWEQCSRCFNEVYHRLPYCPGCGAKLDWSGNE